MFLDPYAIDGATATAAQQRRENFKHAKGATGIDGPEDLKVVPVAGSPGVAGILPGGGTVAVESRRESYSITNTAMDGDALVEVPAAGSSGATHYVIVEVTDPQYHGQEMAVTPRLVSSLSGLTRPYLPLARIDLEAGEGFDATSEVTDLRQVAVPRMFRRLFAYNLVQADGVHDLTATGPGGQWWPDLAVNHWTVDVPQWATHANIIGTWGGVQVTDDNSQGWIWVRLGWAPGTQLGPVDTQHQRWDLSSAGAQSRESWQTADDIVVPPEFRGVAGVPVRLLGRRTHGTDPRPRIDSGASISIDIEFIEDAT